MSISSPSGRMVIALIIAIAGIALIAVFSPPDGKNWVDVLASITPIIIALSIAIISALNYALADKKRNDDLFDKRYEFYLDFSRSVYADCTSGGSEIAINPDKFLKPFAIQAQLIFGRGIFDEIMKVRHDHVLGEYDGRHGTYDLNTDLINIFTPYLMLEK